MESGGDDMPPALPHRSTGTPCPLGPRQLLAFQRQAEGWPDDVTGDELGLTASGVASLREHGAHRICRNHDEAVDALTEAGWITEPTEGGLALNYVRAWEAYAVAPLDRRDDMPVSGLLEVTFADLMVPPCSWVAGLDPHAGDVTLTEQGRALCAAHHAELERARERRCSPTRHAEAFPQCD